MGEMVPCTHMDDRRKIRENYVCADTPWQACRQLTWQQCCKIYSEEAKTTRGEMFCFVCLVFFLILAVQFSMLISQSKATFRQPFCWSHKHRSKCCSEVGLMPVRFVGDNWNLEKHLVCVLSCRFASLLSIESSLVCLSRGLFSSFLLF